SGIEPHDRFAKSAVSPPRPKTTARVQRKVDALPALHEMDPTPRDAIAETRETSLARPDSPSGWAATQTPTDTQNRAATQLASPVATLAKAARRPKAPPRLTRPKSRSIPQAHYELPWNAQPHSTGLCQAGQPA